MPASPSLWPCYFSFCKPVSLGAKWKYYYLANTVKMRMRYTQEKPILTQCPLRRELQTILAFLHKGAFQCISVRLIVSHEKLSLLCHMRKHHR